MIMAWWPNFVVLDRITQWIGIGVEYIIAAILIVVGAYIIVQFTVNHASIASGLLKPVRAFGYLLVAVGIIIGSVTFGRQDGAQDCEARWRNANMQAQIDRAKQEAEAQKNAAALAGQQAEELAKENEGLQKQVQEYDNYLKTVLAEQKNVPVAGCELTSDDVLQLRAIAGAAALGSKRAK